MNYLFQKSKTKKMGFTDFVLEIKRVENKSDFEKLPCAEQHGLQGFYLKISKMNQQRQTTLVIFCMSKSVRLIIPNIANVLQEAFQPAAQINEELKRTKFDGSFCKNFELSSY